MNLKNETAKAADLSDRRSARRSRALQRGLIIFKNANCDQPCVILDVSENGARLKPLDSVIVPQEFTLRDHKSNLHDCSVAWRQGTVIGVKFV